MTPRVTMSPVSLCSHPLLRCLYSLPATELSLKPNPTSLAVFFVDRIKFELAFDWHKLFHRDERSWGLFPKVLIDSSRPMPNSAPALLNSAGRTNANKDGNRWIRLGELALSSQSQHTKVNKLT